MKPMYIYGNTLRIQNSLFKCYKIGQPHDPKFISVKKSA